jgi:hypothetical protein
MRKGVVITKADGTIHTLLVDGPNEAPPDFPGSVDARLQAECDRFPDRQGHVFLAPTDAAWATYWPPDPPPSPAEYPDDLRRSLGSIFAGTAAQKRQRWVDVLEKYPAAAAFLTLLRGPMTTDGKATVTELATRIRTRIGDPITEVLTATEYQSLKTLADSKGLGALFPAYP